MKDNKIQGLCSILACLDTNISYRLFEYWHTNKNVRLFGQEITYWQAIFAITKGKVNSRFIIYSPRSFGHQIIERQAIFAVTEGMFKESSSYRVFDYLIKKLLNGKLYLHYEGKV